MTSDPFASRPTPPPTDRSGGLIAWFASNPVAANLLLVGMIVLGLLSLSSIRKEAFPSLEPDYIRVSVVYDGGTPTLAEEGIAVKIEEALESVSGIKRITSTSDASGSSVLVEKTSEQDLDTLLRDVKTQVDAINNFPAEAEKPVISKARRQDHAIWLQLYGDTDQATLQSLGERLKAELLALSAVSELAVVGKAEPVMAIEADEASLQAYGLTLADLHDAINAESESSLTSSLRNENKVLLLTASEQAYDSEEFRRLPLLTAADGSLVRLGDVARVHDTFDDDSLVMSRFAGQHSIGLQILMDENADIAAIVSQVQDVVADWHSRGVLPAGVELDTWYDNSKEIKQRLQLLSSNAVTGILMVFLVLALFLNLRVAFWVAAGLPFVFFGTLFFMGDSYAALTINVMTTFGFIMALGIVVDDAVVVGESIYTTRRSQGDTLASTIHGTRRVAIPTLFGVLTTVAAFMALANVDGMLGKIYAQFGVVVTICLLLSVVESKLILPCHLAHLNTHRPPAGRGWRQLWPRIQQGADRGLQTFINRLYRPALDWILRLRYAVALAFIALLLLVAGMPLTGQVRVSFFPDIPGEVVNANLSMQTDASFGQTRTNLLRLEQTARSADRQLSDGDNSGITSLQVVASDDLTGVVRVEITPDAPYSSRQFRDRWLQLIGMPEGAKKLQILTEKHMLDNFKVELKAWDSDTVLAAGKTMKQALQQIAGVSGIDDNLSPGQPQIRVVLNAEGRAQGLDSADLASQLLRSYAGGYVQKYQRGKDEVEVQLGYPAEQRQTHSDLMQTRVRTPAGDVVPLTAVADLQGEFSEPEVTRIDGLRAAYVSASVDKDTIASNELVTRLEQQLVPQLLARYPDLKIHFGGEAEEQAETTHSMIQMFVLALLVIFALLAIPLRSYVQPLLIMTAIPFGMVGAILGHWLNDLSISILSLNGILALSGVVVNDSLLLVTSYNEQRRDGSAVTTAIIEACSGRLRAVFLTSITTFAGLAPLLTETSLQAQFLKPAAAALGYGILFATAITLILIPALLCIQEDIRQLLKKPARAFNPAPEPHAEPVTD